jgi:hypothetical protein
VSGLPAGLRLSGHGMPTPTHGSDSNLATGDAGFVGGGGAVGELSGLDGDGWREMRRDRVGLARLVGPVGRIIGKYQTAGDGLRRDAGAGTRDACAPLVPGPRDQRRGAVVVPRTFQIRRKEHSAVNEEDVSLREQRQ